MESFYLTSTTTKSSQARPRRDTRTDSKMQDGAQTGFVKVMYTQKSYPGQGGTKEFANEKLAFRIKSYRYGSQRLESLRSLIRPCQKFSFIACENAYQQLQ